MMVMIGIDPAKPGSEKTVLYYRGRDIETLTREELIEALRCVVKSMETSCKLHESSLSLIRSLGRRI